MSWRPTRQQFYTYGLAAACCTAEARQVQSVTTGSPGVFELLGHGMEDGSIGRFRAEGNPSSLPTGLAATNVYEVLTNGGDLFTVKLAGVPVAVTAAGEGVLTWIQDMGATLDDMLDGNVSYLEANARAYKPPFQTPPLWAIMTVCELTAYKFALVLRQSSPSYSLEDLRKKYDDAQAFVARLNTGEPTADDPPDASPETREGAAVGWQETNPDGRGWFGDTLQ